MFKPGRHAVKTDHLDTVWAHVGDGAVVDYKRSTYAVSRDLKTDDRAVALTCVPRRCPRCPHAGRPHPGAEVRVLFPGHPHYVTPGADVPAQSVTDALGEPAQAVLAEALVTVRLGARQVGVIEDGADRFTCPPLREMRPKDLVHHLYLFHDLSGVHDPSDLPSAPGAVLVQVHRIAPARPEHDH